MHTFPVKALSVLVAASIALHPVSFAAGKTQVYAATGEKSFVSPVKADPQAGEKS